MSKQFLLIIAVVVLGLFGILTLSKKDENKSGSNTSQNSKASATEHIYNPGERKVTLIEYGDFQCPACKAYYPVVAELKKEYKDKVTFQFRHFPLVTIHTNAFLGSRAAEAAGNQGKFFEMHDLLYENQESWSTSKNPTPILESYAQQLNLDMTKFKTDMMSSRTSDIINADVSAGQAAGANSTPTFVLNGKKIENPRGVDAFKKVLDEELAK